MNYAHRGPGAAGLVCSIAVISPCSVVFSPTALAQVTTQAQAPTAAQTAPLRASAAADTQAGPLAPAADNSAAPAEIAEIKVTGTRIIREGYTTPTPVQAVSLQELQDGSRANIGETLNQLPVFQGSFTAADSQQGIAENTQTELNLRNLGANRTLVLLDGRRLPSSNTESVPDISLIPEDLISRVDVVTGGASAVYGSDAITGVVNFILDTNFTGVKGSVQGGISGYGDGPSDKASLTLGKGFFNDRVHVLLSGDQSYQATVLGTSRPWNVTGRGTIQNPAYAVGSNVPQFLQEACCVATTYPIGGLVVSGPLQGTAFGPGGTVTQYDYGIGGTAPGSLHTGGTWMDSTEAGGTGITPDVAARHWFARISFSINDDTEIYAQYMGAWNHSIERCCWVYYPNTGPFYTSNPFIPQSVLNEANQLGVTQFNMGYTMRYPVDSNTGEFGGLGANNIRYMDVYVVGGEGKFDLFKTKWSWDTYAQQGISGENYNVQQTIVTNMADAIHAVRVGSYGPGYDAAIYTNPRNIPAGTITCASNLLPVKDPNATSNCQPINVFGPGLYSEAAIDYTQGDAHLRQFDTTSTLGASITGEPFSDWAGPISVALSGEWRHEIAAGTSDPLSLQAAYFSQDFYPLQGSQHVIEGAAETVIPLLKDKPLAQSLDFNGAVRETDYSTSGAVTTWKMGLEWTPIHDIRFRGSQSFDIRAPNLSNLFGLSSLHGTTNDPFFNNVLAPSFTNTLGNPNLVPEKSHQLNLGLILQPSVIEGLQFSADWYRIKITGAITTLGANLELQDCYGTRIPGTVTGTSPYCQYVLRNPDNSLYGVEVVPFNVASFRAQGIDYQLDYRSRLDRFVKTWPGVMQFSLELTNTMHLITDTGVPGPTETLEGAGYGNSPKWQGRASFAYDLDPFRFVVTEHFVGRVAVSNTDIYCTTNCPTNIPAGFQTVNFDPTIGSYFSTEVAAQYRFWEADGGSNATAFLSADNVFNRIPPWGRVLSATLWAVDTNTSLYNTMGLYVRAGVRFRF